MIGNELNTLSEDLKEILPKVSNVDALVGYFYFSGFQELYKELSNKKIRILVGMDIDKSIINDIVSVKNFNIENYVKETTVISKSSVRANYIEEFSTIFNNTDTFDNSEATKAFEIFLEKIKNGSLEIRKTIKPNHSKLYVLTFDEENKVQDEFEGYTIIGSNNLTFSGLKGQDEAYEVLPEHRYYKKWSSIFNNSWDNSENIVITNKDLSDEFIKEIKNKIWLYKTPTPLEMYQKVLLEYFSLEEDTRGIKGPNKITGGKFIDLKYQIDAINIGIDRINKFGGVIISDVVGLGKSIIASAIAHNLGFKTIVICPPHLEDQWVDYRNEFNFNCFTYTTGKIEEALERHGNETDKLLIILDEAHKHRNEETDNYQLLHKLCAGHNVVALSATPFNNDPKDIYAIIKLFSTPGKSTLKTVENLSTSFHDLFTRYKKVRKSLRKKDKKNKDHSEIEVEQEANKIADELRKMIEPLIIRRSRRDLEQIDDYRKDLEIQGVTFSKVRDPELLEYDLGEYYEIYKDTLEMIAHKEDEDIYLDDDGKEITSIVDAVIHEDTFIGARYKPASYLKENSQFLQKLLSEEEDDDLETTKEKLHVLKIGQTNIAKFMRRLMVRRFESSIDAFKMTLNNVLVSSEKMLDWYLNMREVPIFKKGVLPDVEFLMDLDEKELEDLFKKFEGKGLLRIPASDLDPIFKTDLEADIALLKGIKNTWKEIDYDPKYEYFKGVVDRSLKNEPYRKIVVFSEFTDTANSIYKRLKNDGYDRVFKYSSEDSSQENKKIIKRNFDAGIDQNLQENKFDLIVATDAISEGFNLHRAGTIINYDIPYNPTRVVQRVGRINRINKKVFEELFIYNFFPSVTGEEEIGIRGISTLKKSIINNLLGDDTRTLTSDEELKNYFTNVYKEEKSKIEKTSWDAEYRNDYFSIINNNQLVDKLNDIPHRTRILKFSSNLNGVITFAKRSGNYVFALGNRIEDIELVSPETGLKYFKNGIDNTKSEQTTNNFQAIYDELKKHVFKDNTLAKVVGQRKHDSLDRLELLSELLPKTKEFCEDVIKLIKDFDALPSGTLKGILEIKIDKNNLDEAFNKLKELIPQNYINNLMETAGKSDETGRIIVLSEEIIKNEL